jgi:hypothetical protein
MKARHLALVLFLFLALALASRAATIWDNGGPDQANGFFSDFQDLDQAGDNFTVAGTATANQIQWWGGYAPSNTPTAPDNFTVRFFTITGGVPNTVPLFQYSIGDVGKVDSGLDVVGLFDIYTYSATIPDTLLGPGSYLLSIVNNTTGDTNDDWFWATSNNLGGESWRRTFDGDPWTARNVELAFNISGTSTGTGVPDTGTSALLFGFGFATILSVQRFLGWRRVAI